MEIPLQIVGRAVESRFSDGRKQISAPHREPPEMDWHPVARSLDCPAMRRKPWARAIGAFLATWFTLVASEHAPLNPCPMHGDLPLAAATPVDSHSHGEAAPAESGHGNHDSGKCSCAGDCASQQLSAPEFHRAYRLTTPIGIGEPIGISVVSDPPTATPFLRPFANGPPLRIG